LFWTVNLHRALSTAMLATVVSPAGRTISPLSPTLTPKKSRVSTPHYGRELLPILERAWLARDLRGME
jgi:hypothetical protein